MTGYIIPDSLHSVFEVKLEGVPCKTGLAKIYTGTNAGSWFVNAAIENSCPEWKAAWPAALKLAEANGISVTPVEIDPTTLINPNTPKLNV